MFKDLRHGLRTLLQAKGWTAVVVLSLALGIGANTALFSAVNGMLLRKIPVRDPDSVVRLRYVGRNDMVTSSSDYGFSGTNAEGQSYRATFSYPMYQQFLVDNKTMTDLVACAPYSRLNVSVDGAAEIASGFISSGNFYLALGIPAALGRTILPDDDRADAPPVAVISTRYWRSRFGGDPNVVGKVVRMNNVPVTIVGVLTPSFTGVQQAVGEPPDVSVPLALDLQLAPPPPPGSDPRNAPRLRQPTYWWLQLLGRLKPGSTPQQVQGNLEGVFQQTARAGMASYLSSLTDEMRSRSTNRNRTEVPRLSVEPGGRGVYEVSADQIRSVSILSGVVALVLLIVCANVANLLLSRATTRRKEISIRLSLGATRPRLIRQLLTESLLLSSIGGALGIAVGYWGQRLLPGQAGQPAGLDWRILLFVVLVSGVTGIVFGLAPAFGATGVNVSSALKETSRSIQGSRSLLSKSLLVVQVAISLVLLVGAGLFLRTLQNLRNVDVGFDPRNLVLFRLSPGLNGYDEKRIASLYGQLIERLQGVPGVRGAALSNPGLLTGSMNTTGIFIEGKTYTPGLRNYDNGINRLVVSPSFFETMGIKVARGRGFTGHDQSTAPKVALINEAAVKKYFANEDALGRRFGHSIEKPSDFEIVGILRDTKYNSVRDPAPPTMYVPYLQANSPNVMFEVRTAADPSGAMGAIREAVRQVDPNLPITDMMLQTDQIERRFLQEKVFAQAYALFGGLAVLLASIGLFGLMSYNVARRTNEIGVRMALGARREDVLRLVMRESMLLVVIGIVIGLAMAFGASRFVAAQLFNLAPNDLLSMVLATLLMVTVSALAGFLPARRASRVDPMVALHYE